MRRLRFLLEKEFLQIFRNRSMLPIIFLLPAIQLIVLSFVATYELREVRFVVVDHDQSEISRTLIRKFQANEYYTLSGQMSNIDEAKQSVLRGSADMLMVLPGQMERNLMREESVRLLLMIDAVTGNKASLIQSYSRAIIQDYNEELQVTTESAAAGASANAAQLPTVTRVWYNPTLDYVNYMVPGILVVLITMIALFLSGMNVVREKEIGTIEQLNVTPIRKSEFILSKLLPFWSLALVELGVGLIIAYGIFGVPMQGSVWTIYSTAAIYLIAVQGIGLYISTVTHTQQQAMFIAWFVMVIFILMGGLFTPIESMPEWARDLTYANPVAYFIDIMRRVMLKGAGYADFWPQVMALAGFAAAAVGFSILQYRKVSRS